MTLEQLRIFVAVAEREHVTQAAAALHLTQSAVSSAISALEARHDVILFKRIGRRVALTEAGKLFLCEAQALLRAGLRAEKFLADLGGVAAGAVAVAASQTVGNYWLPARIARFKAAHPGVAVRLSIGNTEEVAKLTASGDIDFGLVEGEVVNDVLNAEMIDHDDPVVVAAPEMAARVESGALSLACGGLGGARKRLGHPRRLRTGAAPVGARDRACRRRRWNCRPTRRCCRRSPPGPGSPWCRVWSPRPICNPARCASCPGALPRRPFFALTPQAGLSIAPGARPARGMSTRVSRDEQHRRSDRLLKNPWTAPPFETPAKAGSSG